MRKTKDLNKNNMCVGAGPVSAQKGITLIALVITIIVMLILVAVTISMAVNGGLFDYAGKAVGETQNALNQEQQLINDIINEYIKPNLPETEGDEPVETISKETSYVGCYADVDGDGNADGVIYADLAFSKEANYWYGYSYEAVAAEELKDYYVSGTHDGAFNEEGTPKEVVTATGEGKDRFYVMALENVTTADYPIFCWYSNAYGNMSDYVTATSTDFGAGKANTATIKGIWDASTETPYGTQNARDLWAQINLTSGWFVPSIAEWDAFADAFDVDSSNYSDTYGLSVPYWSSSPRSATNVWIVGFNGDDMFDIHVNSDSYVRLSATF